MGFEVSSITEMLSRLYQAANEPDRFENSLIRNFSEGTVDGRTYDFGTETGIQVIRLDNPETGEDYYIEERIKVPKNELLSEAIRCETYGVLANLKSTYEQYTSYDVSRMFFSRILDCFLKVWDLDESVYTFKKTFLLYFSDIASESITLYKNYFSDTELIKKVSRKIDFLRTTENQTGYKLHPSLLHGKAEQFIDHLVSKGYIGKTDTAPFKQFLNGVQPSRKMDWKREPRYLVYFITCLTSRNENRPTYLLKPPGQKWKCLYEIFTCEGDQLPEKFYETYSKLGKKQKGELNLIFGHLEK